MSNVGGRGALTERVQEKAREHLGREISTRELRLIPYIQYLLVNDGRLEERKVNDEEIGIIENWAEKGWISGVIEEKQVVSESFWKAMNDILWVSYVNYSDQAVAEAEA